MTAVDPPRAALAALARPFRGPGAALRVAAGLALLGTVCSQHPNPAFGRVMRWDAFSALFPNWRFFAPNPAQHDFQFHYRTLSHAGETSEWCPVEVIAGRMPHQIAWFPGRRPEKAVFDLGSEVIQALDKGFSHAVHVPAYRLLRAYLADEVERSGRRDVKGFQFTLVRTAGYDESEEPEVVFVSPYTPMPREAGRP
ncbi:hypothetical protein D7319_07245 [Streptomyces radicis]|uniref:Uncharacterized protein n=2 Tax=Streptomyces radicis TaxID=1750517 RepID=A0A3A9WDN5_9ACTN|nr:hypothetical protein D7319_07245 [Streptomyces radicis]RKN25415.1 hypothetical protein D7318_08100 [Streptomyces radicis]